MKERTTGLLLVLVIVFGIGLAALTGHMTGLFNHLSPHVQSHVLVISGNGPGSGTGTLLSGNVVLTAHHVVGIIGTQIEVITSDGKTNKVVNVIASRTEDAALLVLQNSVVGVANYPDVTDKIPPVGEHINFKGIPMKGAQTNDIGVRVEATRLPMTRLIDGKPGLLIQLLINNLF